MEHAERLVLADLRAPVKIAALCRELAIGERVLRDAFYRIRGLPPYQCLQMLRLSEVRRALMSAGGQSVTVTEIATNLGFVELGRFSVEYRKMFGESPSETLREAVRRSIRFDEHLTSDGPTVFGPSAGWGWRTSCRSARMRPIAAGRRRTWLKSKVKNSNLIIAAARAA